jgi:hypothetical protein
MLLDPVHNLIVIDQFTSRCLLQPSFDLLDKPCIVVEETLDRFLDQVR